MIRALWVMLLVWAAPLAAQTDLHTLNLGAVEAFQAGDLDRAFALTKEAATAPDDMARAEPDAFILANVNLSFLLGEKRGAFADAVSATERGISFAQTIGLDAGQNWVTLLNNRARALGALGDARAGAALDMALAAGRGTDQHGRVVATGVDVTFALGDFPRMARLAEEMVAVTGGWKAQTNLTDMSDRQSEMEALGDADAVGALIDTRILLVGVVQPDLRDRFAHAALWAKFHVLNENEDFGAASDALRDWATTGEMLPAEELFVRTMAENSLTLVQLSGYGTQSGTELGYAELAVTFAELAYAPSDPRIAQALRERAAAEQNLGLYARAETTLQAALAILAQNEGGEIDRVLVLEILGNGALEQGATEQAVAFYLEAGEAYQAALNAGEAGLSNFDVSVMSLNRARVALDVGEIDGAVEALVMSSEAFDRAAQAREIESNQYWHLVGLSQTTAMVRAAQGDVDAALAATRDWVDSIHTQYPELHPRKARALMNAADQLYVLGAPGEAEAVLADAVSVARETIPLEAGPQADATFKAALFALAKGDRARALALMREVALVRQAPQNRARLAEARWELELLAWALLDAAPDAPEAWDEALAALQWTQMTRSSEALADMGARLEADPTAAVLMKAQQDAEDAVLRNRSAVMAALSAGEPTEALFERQDHLDASLTRATAALSDMGLALTGVAPITPLTLAQIQALLAPGEVLVTFVLPGLNPEVVTGLDGSSNRAIAITREGIQFGPVDVVGRGEIQDMVADFRCEMAISDLECGAGFGAGALRGAMLEPEAAPQEPAFDYGLAHGLYAALFGGIEDAVQGAERLLIVPPADLLGLPFSALLTAPDRGQGLARAPWLIRRQALSVLPSISALEVLRGDRAAPSGEGLTFLGVGDPIIGRAGAADCGALRPATLRSANALAAAPVRARADGLRLADPAKLAALDRLPDTACELAAIRDVVGPGRSALLLADEARESRIKALDGAGELARADVVVFATHGLVSGEAGAQAPGLVLTPPDEATALDDGLLTAAEVATLTLDARLVVLSACNTAAGEEPGGEGLSGLAGSFIHAGARALMVTHWSVYSEASARISASIVSQLAADPALGNAEALRRATLALLDQAEAPLTRHPAWWAPFAIVGD